MKWISTSDAVPRDNHPVIAWSNYYGRCIAIYNDDDWVMIKKISYDESRKLGGFDGTIIRDNYYKITHWMPLSWIGKPDER